MVSKFNKIIISLMLTIILTVCGASIVAYADESGNGYKYYSDTYTLEITSDAAMKDYTEQSVYDRPWHYYRGAIKTIIIDDGVTKIGNYIFSTHTNLSKVVIPNSVKSIGDAAFVGCDNLTSITISDEVKSIGENAFGFNSQMEITDGFACICNQGSYAQKYCFMNYIPFDYPYQDGMYEVNVEASGGEQIIWSFVPKVDGNVKFYSTGKYDTYGVIYDSNTYVYSNSFNQMVASAYASNDDNGTSVNFLIDTNLKAGVRYYFSTRFAIASKTGSYKVFMEFECNDSNFVEQYTTATCTEGGNTTYICENCETKKVVAVGPLGHRYVETGYYAPTCTDDGEINYQCSECSELYYEIIDALGHDEIVNRVEPNCTDAGYIDTTCTRCEYFNHEVIEPLGHDMNRLRIEPTCTETGFDGTECSRCSYREGVVLRALEHNIRSNYIYPTCTTTGSITYYCLRCDYKDVTILDKTSHMFKLYNTILPTCEVEGRNIYKCNNCDEEYYDVIPKINHNFLISSIESFDGEEFIRAKIVFDCQYCHTELIEDFRDYLNTDGSSSEFNPFDLNHDGIINAKDYAMLPR